MEDNKSGSTFHDKSGYTILLVTLNLWGNIQIVKTCILKHNVSNPMSLVVRYLNFETLYYHFGHAPDMVMYHVLDNVEDTKKIYFLIQKYICYGCTFGKMYQCSFPENPTCSSKPLRLIHSDHLELPTLSYSKYKWIITFLNNYSSFYNIVFLCKKFEDTDIIKSIF